jgi:hypothetical protein
MEALAEIKAVAKKEPVLAAEGAVLFLEKLAPAIRLTVVLEGLVLLSTATSRRSCPSSPRQMSHVLCVKNGWAGCLRLSKKTTCHTWNTWASSWGELCTTPETASKWADYHAQAV